MNRLISGIYGTFVSRSREFLIFGISLILIGLVFSKVLISIGVFTILGSWLLSGRLREKLVSFARNKIAVTVSLIYIVHLLGMLYSEDLAYGLKDLRIKLPLLLFPLVFSTVRPLSAREFRFFHLLFVTAVTVTTLISTYLLFFGAEIYMSDKRNVSVFISHIRLSLMICLSFFVCIWYFFQSRDRHLKWLFLLPVIWFPLFLILVESFTGMIILGITAAFYFLLYLRRSGHRKLMTGAIVLLLVLLCVPAAYFHRLYEEFRELQTPKELPFRHHSAGGEPYAHPARNNPKPARQNGYLVYQNIAWEELISTWNERSKVNFDSNAINGYPVRHVILWYLTSRGWNKDAEAIAALEQKEVQAIERGVANAHYLNRPGMEARILQTYWEISQYFKGGDVNGHSLTMRWEFWKTAVAIWKDQPIFGVGTGDIKQAFADQYEKDNSRLDPKWRLRTHNQYLSFAVAFGLAGLSVILYALFLPVLSGKHHVIYLTFCCILFLSMINEDTLETQTGVTLFAFFNSFYLFLGKRQL